MPSVSPLECCDYILLGYRSLLLPSRTYLLLCHLAPSLNYGSHRTVSETASLNNVIFSPLKKYLNYSLLTITHLKAIWNYGTTYDEVGNQVGLLRNEWSWTTGVRFQAGKIFLFTAIFLRALGSTQLLTQSLPRLSGRCLKLTTQLPSNVEVQNTWICTRPNPSAWRWRDT